ncbi:MAG: CHAT domain-containing protein [Caldilineaceae bacterium]
MSKTNILDEAARSGYVHLACHGYFNWGHDTLSSALLFANFAEHSPDNQESHLLLSDVIDRLFFEQTRLVTLSACETGLTKLGDLQDEFIGFPSGFMQAGAPAVISSLWTVDDLSTALLMEMFYEYHIHEQLPPVQALQKAQLWLRHYTYRKLNQYVESLLSLPLDRGWLIDKYKEISRHDNESCPFASPYYWAAFTFYGA